MEEQQVERPSLDETPLIEQPTVLPPPEDTAEEAEEEKPTKSIKNFWERLDEVFQLNLQSKKWEEKLASLLEQFPDTQKISTDTFRSYLFQPERISISSNNDIQPSSQVSYLNPSTQGHQVAETFNSFRIRLNRSLINVKSIQLLSAVIPNAIQNIPDDQCIFFYYKLRTIADANLGAWDGATTYYPGDIVSYTGNNYACQNSSTNIIPGITYWTTTLTPSQNIWSDTTTYNIGDSVSYNGIYYVCQQNNTTGIVPSTIYWSQMIVPANTARPNYYDLNPWRIQVVFLQPTFTFPAERLGNYLLYNRTFSDYNDLLASMNACANDANSASIPGDVSFTFDNTLNKFQFIGSEAAAGNAFYLPCGYEDKNMEIALLNASNPASSLYLVYQLFNFSTATLFEIFRPNYTLNLRLGFTWNGIFPNPFTVANLYTNTDTLPRILYFYLRNKDPGIIGNAWTQVLLTANSYGDLVNTSCVKVYTDITFGSTQVSTSLNNNTFDSGLLSIVPVNTNNLGVGFYQNNFDNALTKIPKIISEIGIRLYTDQDIPYNLPNSATVTLELAITYY